MEKKVLCTDQIRSRLGLGRFDGMAEEERTCWVSKRAASSSGNRPRAATHHCRNGERDGSTAKDRCAALVCLWSQFDVFLWLGLLFFFVLNILQLLVHINLVNHLSFEIEIVSKNWDHQADFVIGIFVWDFGKPLYGNQIRRNPYFGCFVYAKIRMGIECHLQFFFQRVFTCLSGKTYWTWKSGKRMEIFYHWCYS